MADHPARLRRAAEQMSAHGVDALLLGPGADLRYLIGYDPPPLERLTLLVVRADATATLVLPALEEELARHAGLPEQVTVAAHGETDDAYALVRRALGDAQAGRLAVGDRLWTMFTLALQDQLPQARWALASTVTSRLRAIKEPAEIAALREAGAAIDRVHQRLPGLLAPGRTEAEVARDVAAAIVEEGHEQVSFVIVAAGPNAASPHHESGSRRLRDGDPVLVDIGGMRDGYGSDCTRNYVLGEPPADYAQAYARLREAQEAAVAAIAPGVTSGAVDAAARDRLAAAGLAEAFVHRTGHGIGLEEHEAPWIAPGGETLLEPGMVFSVEPGVYLPDRWGMRLEDIVVVTEQGAESLNRLPHDLVRV